MSTPETLTAGIEAYQSGRDAIMRDLDLNEDGKSRQIDALRSQALDSLTRAGDQMWRGLEAQHAEVDTRIRLEAGKVNGSFDYQRLAYESAALASAVAGRDLKDVEKLYEDLHLAGDAHRLRAARDTLPALLAQREGGRDDARQVNSLVQRIQRDAEAAAITPAMQQAQADAAAVVGRIEAAHAATRKVMSAFQISGGLFGASRDNALVQWMSRVEFSRERVEGVGVPKYKVTARFRPASQDGGR